jgi:glycerate kinase
MRIVVLTESWPDADGTALGAQAATQAVVEAWTAASPSVHVAGFPLGDGGARSADAFEGPRLRVGGADAVDASGTMLVAPAAGARRWEPHALATALLGLAADAAGREGALTVMVPVGDEPPAGDATDLWLGGLEPMRAGVAALDLVAAVSSQRALLGFHGMSASVRNGRESDEALARAAQEQELRWAAIAQEADPVAAHRTLLGTTRVSDRPGTGAAGGLAYCLAALGARIVPASAALAALAGADHAGKDAALVVAVVPSLEPRTLDDGAIPAASAIAARAGVPAIVLAPHTRIGRRDLMNAGIASAHDAAPGVAGLIDGVRRIAQTWTPER